MDSLRPVLLVLLAAVDGTFLTQFVHALGVPSSEGEWGTAFGSFALVLLSQLWQAKRNRKHLRDMAAQLRNALLPHAQPLSPDVQPPISALDGGQPVS